MGTQTVSVPDIGGTEGAEVIEVSIAAGDVLEEEQTVVVLETDKASMDVPSPVAGKVTAVNVNVGDKVSEGDALFDYEADTEADTDAGTGTETDSENQDSAEVSAEPKSQPAEKAVPDEPSDPANEAPASSGAAAATGQTEEIVTVPEGAEDSNIVDVLVRVGDIVEEGDSLIVLETDKASMEVPSPSAGKVVSIAAKQNEKTTVGKPILTLEVAAARTASQTATPGTTSTSDSPVSKAGSAVDVSSDDNTDETVISASQSKEVYAGPAVRKFAREMAVDLTRVTGTSERGRINKDDVKAHVKLVMSGEKSVSVANGVIVGGLGITPIPPVDFSQFGEVAMQSMSKVKKLTAANMSRNWLNIPHVTQFDDADITDLEEFRNSLKSEAEKHGSKLTLLPFLLKACAAALAAEPAFNVSLHHDGEHLVQKKYVHIGIAVDSPVGLVVPVIRDVDKKGLWELTAEFTELVGKAREGKSGPKDMQGGCFTISSLGPAGGQGFTPVVNAPEVAILGVSKAEVKPKWNGNEFVPRTMLPLSLSYDHRAINGGDAGRFFTCLNSVIGDIRRLLL